MLMQLSFVLFGVFATRGPMNFFATFAAICLTTSPTTDHFRGRFGFYMKDSTAFGIRAPDPSAGLSLHLQIAEAIGVNLTNWQRKESQENVVSDQFRAIRIRTCKWQFSSGDHFMSVWSPAWLTKPMIAFGQGNSWRIGWILPFQANSTHDWFQWKTIVEALDNGQLPLDLNIATNFFQNQIF